jgi:hypothetical protein
MATDPGLAIVRERNSRDVVWQLLGQHHPNFTSSTEFAEETDEQRG